MALVSLNYTMTLSGSQLDADVKAAAKGQDPNKNTQMGAIMWSVVLGDIYNDFNSILSSALTSYIGQAGCLFPIAPIAPFVPGALSLSSLPPMAQSTNNTIDSDIKNECKPLGAAQSYDTMGGIAWKHAFNNIFTDMCNLIPPAIEAMCNSGTVNVMPGAVATPHTGTVASVPATLTKPYVATNLKNSMQSTLNLGTATQMGNSLSSQIKGALSSSKEYNTMGITMWTLFLTQLQQKVQSELETHIRTFLTGQQNFTITIGDPGTNPALIPPVLPTSGTMYGTMI